MKRTHYQAQTNRARDLIVDRECAKLEKRQAAAKR